MSNNPVDRANLEVTGKHRAITGQHVAVEGDNSSNDVTIIVTRAFGPKGDNLIGISDVVFDGYPALTLLVEADGRQGELHLSPIHGDDRKVGFTDIPFGAKCRLLCPVSKQPLDHIGEVEDQKFGAHYYAIYLTEKLSEGSLVAISDVWGHYHSRIIDDFELISHWQNHEELDA